MACTIGTQTSFRTRAVMTHHIHRSAHEASPDHGFDRVQSLHGQQNPIVVFNMYTPGILRDAVLGETLELWFAMNSTAVNIQRYEQRRHSFGGRDVDGEKRRLHGARICRGAHRQSLTWFGGKRRCASLRIRHEIKTACLITTPEPRCLLSSLSTPALCKTSSERSRNLRSESHLPLMVRSFACRFRSFQRNVERNWCARFGKW